MASMFSIMSFFKFPGATLLLIASLQVSAAAADKISTKTSAECAGINFTSTDETVRIEISGKLFTEYHFKGAPHVYFYPLIGPGGVALTRNAPMKEAEGEERDHPHHRSLWFSHGEVNHVDFWSETAKAGKIEHDGKLSVSCHGESGVIRSGHRWVAPGGKIICTDETTFRVWPDRNVRTFDIEVALKAPADEDVILGDTKEGTMGIRLAESMRLKPNKFNAGKPTGHIVQSTGVRDDDTWGKRAEWCDYYGPVDGKIVGVAIFDHPENPRHPTWWHVRDYGLFAANPFGVHDFEKKPEGAGNLTIPRGKTMIFRYRFVLHEGDEKQAGIADLYQKYATEKIKSK